MNAVTRYDIVPSYSRGFLHAWEVSGALADPGPWMFQVEESPAPGGPYLPISPELPGTYSWAEPHERRVGKDPVLYFRVRLRTASSTYYSTERMPYGDLEKRDFLIGRDIMRREHLHMSTGAGTLGEIYLVSTFGPKCKVCIDPITGQVRDSKCKTCLGTGRQPPYHGPYKAWFIFSDAQRTTQLAPNGANTVQPSQFSVRMLGAPPAKKNDAIVDTRTDKRYYVDKVDNAAEVRRVPLIQILTVHEAPTTDAVYKLPL